MAPPPRVTKKVSGTDDEHVSVSIEEPEGDSIFVEFSNIDTGEGRRVQLRRKPSKPAMAAVTEDEPLSEVSVVIDDV
jgi:phenylpyruvate tautomerase PptA (4-oxalocrotonate tautomerase family)